MIGGLSREARPSPGVRHARGQAHTWPLTPPVAAWAAVCGGVAVLAAAAGSRAVGRRGGRPETDAHRGIIGPHRTRRRAYCEGATRSMRLNDA